MVVRCRGLFHHTMPSTKNMHSSLDKKTCSWHTRDKFMTCLPSKCSTHKKHYYVKLRVMRIFPWKKIYIHVVQYKRHNISKETSSHLVASKSRNQVIIICVSIACDPSWKILSPIMTRSCQIKSVLIHLQRRICSSLNDNPKRHQVGSNLLALYLHRNVGLDKQILSKTFALLLRPIKKTHVALLSFDPLLIHKKKA